MTPAQARQIEARERRKHDRENAVTKRNAQAAAIRDCRWAMKHQYPKDLITIKQMIKEQARRCAIDSCAHRDIVFHMPVGLRFAAYREQLRTDLKGFTFQEVWVPAGEINHGDFNAPCTEFYPASTDLRIMWK